MKNVVMFTSFHTYLKSYSLCQVASLQLDMFKNNGYKCRLVIREGAQGWVNNAGGEIVYTPDYIADNDGSTQGMQERSGKTLNELVDDMYQSMERCLVDADVVITHDLIFQPADTIHDMAAEKYAAEHPEVRWLHWIHSATSPRDLNKTIKGKYKNSFICYPNSWDSGRVATNFGYENPDVKVVPHPMDYVRKYEMHPISDRLIHETNQLDVDVF